MKFFRPAGLSDLAYPRAESNSRGGVKGCWYDPPVRCNRRILINGLTILSLLLCVGTCVLWGRSYLASDVIGKHDGQRGVGAITARGGVYIYISTPAQPVQEFAQPWHHKANPPRDVSPPRASIAVAGFKYVNDQSGAWRERALLLPYWMVALIGGAIVVLSLAALRRRPRADVCARCGYDLRATPDRCPECGKTTASTCIVENQGGKPAPK